MKRHQARLLATIFALRLWALDAAAQSASASYAFTTLAGTPRLGSADGSRSDARFNGPSGVAVDSVGNLFVADTWNSVIRKVTTNGVVTTVAGSAGMFGSTDGTGSAAQFYFP